MAAMAGFVRGKQAGMPDLSAGIDSELFTPKEQVRYGVTSQISCIAYDPVQSIMAVGTAGQAINAEASQLHVGTGTIYVYGRDRVHQIIRPKGGASLRQLQFSANRLVSLDAKSELAIWDLHDGSRLGGNVTAGSVVCMAADPMLDWAFLGLSSGDIVAYDLDRDRLAPFRVQNLWKSYMGNKRDSRVRGAPTMIPSAGAHLVTMQMHPRDAGKLLVGYAAGAVVYSFKQNQATKYFEYVVPPGAPGGNGESSIIERRPRLTQAVWHPSGTFVLTTHDDGSLVFWDAKDGRLLMARTLYELDVDKPSSAGQKGPPLLDPFAQIAWCCKNNPDDTALLIAGGLAFDAPEKGLTFLELGPTPVYSTSTWQILSDHFKGKRQHMLPIPAGTNATGFCLAPRTTPHFGGAHDPIAVFTLLNSGEMLTLSFPSGYPISPTNQLHPSLSFASPFVSTFAVTLMPRDRWLGFTERRNLGEPLLKGGAPTPLKRNRSQSRSIVQTAHADGTVRVWDAGYRDSIENTMQLQVDVARAVGRDRNVDISALFMAVGMGELVVGTRQGEVLLFRWGTNKAYERTRELPPLASNPGGFTDISGHGEQHLQDGLQPWIRYEMMQGAVTALKMADGRFVAVGSDNGFLSILDLNGPAVIFHGAVADFAKAEKKLFSSKRSSSAPAAQKDYPVVIEFAVLTLEGKQYSSLVCIVGTNQGKVSTFELLPSGTNYKAECAGSTDLRDRIVSISPIVVESGAPASATSEAVAGLQSGNRVNGTLVVMTRKGVRIFKPVAAKGASKSFDDVFCYAAAMVALDERNHALVGVFGDGTARAYSLPGLKEIHKAPLTGLNPARFSEAAITPTGDIYGWAGPSEILVFSVWGYSVVGGLDPHEQKPEPDTLIDSRIALPPRPTISNLQWIAGTQYVSPTDLDILIGGPDRPPSKRMLAAAAEEKRQARNSGAGYGGTATRGASAGASQEGWGDYLTRQLNQRTDSINFMSDSVDSLQESSQGWADDVSKYVAKQKRGLVLGAVKSKFF